jgi:U4/U6 small nuclear ribonucleoprotein PRP31
MSTLADELLQDFEDSGSEADEVENGSLLHDDPRPNGSEPIFRHADNGDMELDGDEDEVDEDEAMTGINNGTIDALDDEAEAKAKVEKLQLGAVEDVRSVAGLMKTLEPVLEVSISQHPFVISSVQKFTSCMTQP